MEDDRPGRRRRECHGESPSVHGTRRDVFAEAIVMLPIILPSLLVRWIDGWGGYQQGGALRARSLPGIPCAESSYRS